MDKDLRLYKHRNHNEHHKTKDDELLESLKDSPQFKTDIHNLSKVYMELFGTEKIGNYVCYTNEGQQCADGSDLYTLIKYQGKDMIVKVGGGEFNTKVFTTGNIKELKGFYNSPIPLFVVNQSHSYLGNDEDRAQKDRKPKEYLDKFAVIVSPKGGKAEFRSMHKRYEEKIDYTHIHIRHYADALAMGRLALLQKAFPNGDWDKAVYMIKTIKLMDFDQFYKQIWKGRKYLSEEMDRLLGCLWHMGVNTTGCAIGDKEAFMSLYELIQSFDVYKQVFVSHIHTHERKKEKIVV